MAARSTVALHFSTPISPARTNTRVVAATCEFFHHLQQNKIIHERRKHRAHSTIYCWFVWADVSSSLFYWVHRGWNGEMYHSVPSSEYGNWLQKYNHTCLPYAFFTGGATSVHDQRKSHPLLSVWNVVMLEFCTISSLSFHRSFTFSRVITFWFRALPPRISTLLMIYGTRTVVAEVVHSYFAVASLLYPVQCTLQRGTVVSNNTIWYSSLTILKGCNIPPNF